MYTNEKRIDDLHLENAPHGKRAARLLFQKKLPHHYKEEYGTGDKRVEALITMFRGTIVTLDFKLYRIGEL